MELLHQAFPQQYTFKTMRQNKHFLLVSAGYFITVIWKATNEPALLRCVGDPKDCSWQTAALNTSSWVSTPTGTGALLLDAVPQCWLSAFSVLSLSMLHPESRCDHEPPERDN